MDDISFKREQIKKAYPTSKAWVNKVRKMPEAQVIAIFLKLKKENKI